MRRTSATVMMAAMLAPMVPAAAQVAPPPVTATIPPSTQVTAPVAMPTVTLPTLSEGQATQLAALLDKDTLTQGLALIPTPPMTAEAREALVRRALDHARAVHAGRLAEADFQRDWGLRPPVFDPLPGFADAVRRDRIAAWFAALPPPYAGYDGLKLGLDRYRGIAAAGGWPTLAVGPDLGFGATGARVIALRQRLAVEDKEVATGGSSFDAGLVEAVRRAQRRYGLNPTGTVSTQTLAALNVPTAARVRQIMANMERWRWLPQELPRDRIQVNIAAAAT